MSPITLDDLCCDELADELWHTLERTRGYHVREGRPRPSPEGIFGAAMADVIRGIESRRRFDLLKRFIQHGSLLPDWDTKSANSADPLNDEERATCVNFVSGHMITKFQGKLAELLAAGPLVGLVEELRGRGEIPSDAELVFGEGIRCAPGSGSGSLVGVASGPGTEGPDALVFHSTVNNGIEILLVAETKSGYVPPTRLRRQWDHHLAAITAGVRIRTERFGANDVHLSGQVVRVLVRPANWKLTRTFRVERDSDGTRQLIMEQQALPAGVNETRQTGSHEWSIRLAWSRDALRAAAFRVAHRYMREVGLALARDPEGKIRADMPPAEAGQNDFLAQLHVAVFRQQDAEPDPDRRLKTIELYNVLGFGWALGHGFRDSTGKPVMLFLEDLLPRP